MPKETKPMLFLHGAKKYIEAMNEHERGIAARKLESLAASDTGSLRIKLLERPIYELIFGYHRFMYFWLDDCLYIVRGFRKKSVKTPKGEIEYAQQMYAVLRGRR